MSKTLNPRLLSQWLPLRADAAPSDAAPKWNMIMPRGVRFREDFPPGGINFDDKYFATIIGNWKLNGGQPMAIDYSHSLDDPFAAPSEKDAAGWMTDLRSDVDGLYALCAWTEPARGKINSGERGGISPTWRPNAIHPMTGQECGPMLLHAGLVNNPFFADMPRVAASVPAAPTPTGAKPVNPKIRAALKLADDCTQDAYDAAILAMFEPKEEAPKEDPAAVEAAVSASVEAVAKPLRAQVAEMVSKVEALTAANTRLEADKRTASVDAVLEKHKRRFVAAQRDDVRAMVDTLGIEKGEKMLASWPQVVPATGVELGVTGGETDPADAHAKFTAAVDTLVKEKGLNRSDANELAIAKHPDLYAAATKRAESTK